MDSQAELTRARGVFAKRRCVVPDLDDELLHALSTLDETLTGLRNWREADAFALEPGDEPTAWPSPLNDEAARDALERLAKAIRPTQGTEQPLPRWWAGSGHRLGMGERPDGRYEHVPLRLVDLDQADLDTPAAAKQTLGLAAQLGASGAGTAAWLSEALHDVSNDLDGTPVDLVSVLARGQTSPGPRTSSCCTARPWPAATTCGSDGPLEAAYERTANRLNDMWTLGNQLQRWLY
jgi:hypothetical protein